jgi:hypothetical protein
MNRDFAARCRAMMLAARTAGAREQLRVWAEELDPQGQEQLTPDRRTPDINNRDDRARP